MKTIPSLVENAQEYHTASLLWKRIEEYKLPYTWRYLEYKYKWDEGYATQAIREYRKFVFLALTSKFEVTPSLDIDEVWHCHILHTQGYEHFSEICGKKLHHFPGMSDENARWIKQYRYTLNRYRIVFESEPPPNLWPRSEPKIRGEIRLSNVLLALN